MLLLQIKKSIILTTNTFLIILLLSFHVQVHAENTENSDLARTLWKQGKNAFNESDYPTALAKFSDSLTIYRQLGDQQSEADLLTWMATVNNETNDFVKALNCLKESKEIYNKLNSKPGERSLSEFKNLSIKDVDEVMKAFVFCINGRIDEEAKDYKSALKKYNNALQLFREVAGMRESEAHIQACIGDIHLGLENYEEAENNFQETLAIYREFNKEDHAMGITLLSIAAISSLKGEFSKSLEYGNKALKIFEQIDDKKEIAKTLGIIGGIYFEQGDYSNAQVFHERALILYQDIGDKENEALAASDLGNDYRSLGSLDIALEYYKQALNITQELGNLSYDEGLLFYGIGQLYSKMGDNKEALEAYNKAMQIFENHNDTIFQGYVLIDIGIANRNVANYLEAIDNLEEGSKILKSSKEDIIIDSKSANYQRKALSTLADIYVYLGDDKKAKEYDLKRKRVEGTEINIKKRQMSSLQDYGNLFFKEDRFGKALDSFQQALALSKEIGDKQGEGSLLLCIGSTYKALGKYSKALDFFRQSLKVSSEQKDKGTEHEVLFFIAYTYRLQQDYQNALEYCKQALIVAKEIGDKYGEEYCFGMMAGIYNEQKKYEKEAEYYERALRLSKEINEQNMTWKIQQMLGLNAENSKQLQKAKGYYSEAINIIESIREKISVEEYKIGFMGEGNKLLVYDNMIRVLWLLKEYEEAFNYVERAKSRSLLDLLGNRMKRGKGKDKGLSQREIRLQKKINELLEKIRKEQSQPKEEQRAIINEWNKEVEQARKEYTDLLINMKQEDPELYSIVSVNPLTLKEIQMLIEPDTTLLEYYLTGYFLHCWVVNKNEYKFLIQSLPELASKITSFREKIATLQPDYEKVAEELYDLLIRPAKPYIKTKRICIVPHSVLHYLPFQALINANGTENKAEKQPRFLIEEYDIFYAPSASVLRFVMEKRKEISGKVLAFGNPEFADKDLNLPHAEEEVKRIKEIYPDTSIYMNENATEEKVKQLSSDYDIIHFASHSELNPKSPLFSCIKMAKEKDEDGRLEVHEIFNLNLENTSLVTLSGCETGLGKLSKGDELIGLTRGFIYAGTPSIVASLWNVNDKSTSDLMSLFYKNLKTHSKVEALRMAQLEMINGEVGRGIVRGVGGITTSKEDQDNPQTSRTVNGSHPYFWAPFILLGDWK